MTVNELKSVPKKKKKANPILFDENRLEDFLPRALFPFSQYNVIPLLNLISDIVHFYTYLY